MPEADKKVVIFAGGGYVFRPLMQELLAEQFGDAEYQFYSTYHDAVQASVDAWGTGREVAGVVLQTSGIDIAHSRPPEEETNLYCTMSKLFNANAAHPGIGVLAFVQGLSESVKDLLERNKMNQPKLVLFSPVLERMDLDALPALVDGVIKMDYPASKQFELTMR